MTQDQRAARHDLHSFEHMAEGDFLQIEQASDSMTRVAIYYPGGAGSVRVGGLFLDLKTEGGQKLAHLFRHRVRGAIRIEQTDTAVGQ